MHLSLAQYSAPVSFVQAPSWADFITTMVGFEVFGTHSQTRPIIVDVDTVAAAVVRTENLNPTIVVMKAAQNGA